MMNKFVLVFLFILLTMGKGENKIEDDKEEDPSVNILLQEMKDLKDDFEAKDRESKRILKELQKQLTELKEKVKNTVGDDPKAAKQDIGVQQPPEILERKMEQSVGRIEKQLKKIQAVASATQSSNKQIMEAIIKIGIQNKEANGNDKNQVVEIHSEVKKEIGERITSELLQMRKWLTGIMDRLSGMEIRCTSLTRHMDDTKNQCIQKLSEQVQNSNPEIFQEEVRKNLSRIERDLQNEMEKMVQNIEWKVPNPVAPTPKPTDLVLPTLPTTVQMPFPVKTACNSEVLIRNAENCAELKEKGGVTCDGAYVIRPQKKKAVIALCDMNTSGGGWTVILRRGQYSQPHTSFHQSWNGYKKGFGRTQREFWIGNDNLHLLTTSSESNKSQELLIQLETFQREKLDMLFDYINIEDEMHNYKIHLGNVSGNFHTLGRPLSILSNRIFRTHDRNEGTENCAANHRGGWWFGESCDSETAVLTAPLFTEDDFRENWQGVQWPTWKGESLLKSVEMKIRTKDDQN